MVSPEVQSHGSSIQWRGNFHWTLCVSTLIQSGVDIASDGLTPLLNREGQHSVLTSQNIVTTHLATAIASSVSRCAPDAVILS